MQGYRKVLMKGAKRGFLMYAIFESGGKQYRANIGDMLEIEKMNVPVGETLELKKVLMIADDDKVIVGTPTIEDAVITCHVVDYTKAKKIHVFKFKKRKNVRRKTGHRQKYLKIKVDEIKSGNKPVEANPESSEEVNTNGS